MSQTILPSRIELEVVGCGEADRARDEQVGDELGAVVFADLLS